MHKSLVRFRFGSVRQKKVGGSVRFGFGKKFLVRSFPNLDRYKTFCHEENHVTRNHALHISVIKFFTKIKV